jgi:hypothetical protein
VTTITRMTSRYYCYCYNCCGCSDRALEIT